tara:strand:- start:1 stop:393 length:393 start_codon:yes stop_codon:yes gene_type:complete
MFKHIIRNSNKNNLFKRSLCNLALDNNHFQYNNYDNYDNYDNDDNNDNNEDLFIEKIKYDNKKKYFSITKQPYYLDEDYNIKKNYFEKLKKINIICESSGSKCFKCNGIGYVLNKFNYDLCPLCNGNGIY